MGANAITTFLQELHAENTARLELICTLHEEEAATVRGKNGGCAYPHHTHTHTHTHTGRVRFRVTARVRVRVRARDRDRVRVRVRVRVYESYGVRE